MSIPEEERKRRFILCQLVVEILRPHDVDDGTTANERLILYCVALSTFGPHPMGLNKIADTVKLPRSTVRAVLTRLCKRDWVYKNGGGSYYVTDSAILLAGPGMKLFDKYRAIKSAADALGPLDYEG